MPGYPYRLQTVWLALLALVWLGFCSPWSMGLNALLATGVVGAALVAIVGVTRRLRALQRATAHTLAAVDHMLRVLPSDLKRHTPLVIAAGDPCAMAGAWGEQVVSVTDAAIWVRCESPSTLMHLADALKRWRGGQGPDGVVLLLAADQGDAESLAATAWKPWRPAVSAASRAVGYVLPVCVAVVATAPAEDDITCPWFGVSGTQRLYATDVPTVLATPLRQYMRDTTAPDAQRRAQQAVLLDSLVRWATATLWPLWTEGRAPLRITAFGMTVARGGPMATAPFRQFVADVTGLAGASVDRGGLSHYPLPNALLAGMPRQPVRRAWPRALAHAVIGLTLFFTIGAAASAWQNRALIQRVADHVTGYQAIPSDQDTARVDALALIKHDRDELERYANVGVPMRLGFGLHRGAPWLPTVNRLIASYQPPAPPPSMVELDSMSLFKSGSAVLNSGSNRVLVAALDMIKAHPDKRILVAGHTDAVGLPATNLRLSEARAAAVRDWLVDASGLSPTKFAIQGYGDTRPKTGNDTEAGRAANRRVEITLIPDCRDDHGSHPTEGHPACS